MDAVFTLSGGKKSFLVAPYDILAALPAKAKFDEEKLERVLANLELDGYFERVSSDRKGEKMYVITLLSAGLNYKREDYQRKRGVYFRWGVVAIGAVISALIGILIRSLLG